MAEPEELITTPTAPFKRSVFRADVLQREIERREQAVPPEDVPRFSTFAWTSGTLALLAVLAGLLAVPVTLSTPIELVQAPSSAGSGPETHLLVSTHDPSLIAPGSVLLLNTSRGTGIRLLVKDTELAPQEAATRSEEAVLQVTALSQNGAVLLSAPSGVSQSGEASRRMRFAYIPSLLSGRR